MKKYTIRRFCADRIDVITNFAVITNVVIKRVQCIGLKTTRNLYLLRATKSTSNNTAASSQSAPNL